MGYLAPFWTSAHAGFKALLLDHPTPGDFWDGGLPVWGEGGVEDWAVRRGEARALSLQREAVVEDFWVAP